MYKIYEKRYLVNKLLESNYRNTENLQHDIINTMENVVKEMLKLNQYLIKIKYLCVINKDNFKLKQQEYTIQKLINLDKNKLAIVIQHILFSKYLRKIFEINESFNLLQVKLLITDIIDNVFLLEFNNDKDISNYILAYVKKFIGTDNVLDVKEGVKQQCGNSY